MKKTEISSLHMQTDKNMPRRHFGNICQFFIEHTDCGLLIAFKQSCFKKKKSANNSCRKSQSIFK